MINFNTTPERYEVSKWAVKCGSETISDASSLKAGDAIRFNVAFFKPDDR